MVAAGVPDVIWVALIGLVGTFVAASAGLVGLVITNRRLGKPNGNGNLAQMTEKILLIVMEHGERLSKLETREQAEASREEHS